MRKRKAVIILVLLIVTLFSTKVVQNAVLFRAVSSNNITLANQMISLGANVNAERFPSVLGNLFETNDTPLTMACRNGDYEMTYFLVSVGADVNLCESWGGATPITAALLFDKASRFQIASFLIAHGADITEYSANTLPCFTPLWKTITIFETDPPETVEQGYELFLYCIEYLNEVLTTEDIQALQSYAVSQRNQPVISYLESRFE